jgi:hypothetical protein
VRIELLVRRFFCDNDACAQQIYAEPLPRTVRRYGRRTCRTSIAWEQITLALGGSVERDWRNNSAFWPALRRYCDSCAGKA